MSDTQDAAASGAGAEAKAATLDPKRMDIAELGRMINDDPEGARLTIADDPIEIAEEPEEVAEESVEEPESVPEEDEEPLAAEAPEEDAPSEDEPVEANPDFELLQLQVAKLERTLSSREGKYGSQQQKIDALERELAQFRAREAAGDSDLDYQQQPQSPPPQPESNGTTQWVLQQAQNEAAQAFLNAHPDLTADGSFNAEFTEHAKKAVSAAGQLSSDPNILRREVYDMLSNAYDDFRIETIQKQKESKSVEQSANLRKNKRAASLSASSGKPTRTKRKPPDPRSMSMDDLRKQIDAGLAG